MKAAEYNLILKIHGPMKIPLIILFISFCLAAQPGYARNSSLASETVASVDSLTILTYNVRNCKGLDDIVDFKRISEVISRINPDVVALQELDSATTRSRKAVVLDEISARTGMYSSYSASISFQGGKYGIGVLTREKPLKTKRVPLPGSEEKRSLLIVELDKYIIFCVHMSLTRKDRDSSVNIINRISKEYLKPVFLAGDMNSGPGSAEIRNLEKEWHVLNKTDDATFPADRPTECIDFIFAQNNRPYTVKVLKSVVENERIASDHCPVWVKLQVTR
jgi:endonuclease/exonuclease/phosphatase family metal-dependent hydrolase